IWVTFETLTGGKLFREDGYTIFAPFGSLKELKNGDEVRMAGVKIGIVERTRLNSELRRAEALLRIDTGVQIPDDVTATISMAGLIGTYYIGVDLGSANAPALEPGAEIKTRVTPDLNTIMSDIGSLGQKLEGALGAFGDALSGDADKPGLFQ